jgi:hypothetical protein
MAEGLLFTSESHPVSLRGEFFRNGCGEGELIIRFGRYLGLLGT